MISIPSARHSNSISLLDHYSTSYLPVDLAIIGALGTVHLSSTAEPFRDLVLYFSEVVSV